MALTDRSAIPAEVQEYYDNNLLDRAIPLYLHTMWAQVRDLPANAGTSTIKFRRYSNLTAATTALTEGVTPSGSALSTTEIQATVQQYGDYVTVTDVLTYESADPVLTEAGEILGDQAGDTLDILTRDVLAAGTTILYEGGHSARNQVTSTDLITTATIRKTVRQLKNNNAKRVTRMVNATTGIATEPVNQAYVGIVHPNTTFTLKSLAEFVPIEKYSSTMTAMPGEVGKIDEVRFVETTNAKVFTGAGASSIDVYGTIVLAMNAYGTTKIAGQGLTNIIKPLGSGGTSDPLNQRATSGWKATFVAKILNDDYLARIEHAVAA